MLLSLRKETEMYRIVRYDSKSKFKAVTFSSRISCSLISAMEASGDHVEVYRCNSQGNNYSGRRVYPVPELKNLTADEKSLYSGL